MSDKFVWEEAYRRTWEEPNKERETKKLYNKIKIDTENRKGIIRHLHIIIDSSENIDSDGFLPNYRLKIIEALSIFISNFYQENPISILTVLVANEDEHFYYELKNPNDSKTILNKMGQGQFNLQKSLKFSYEKIENSKYPKQILIITPTISFKIDNLSLENKLIQVNVIHLCGEVSFLKELCIKTNGKYFVSLDFEHFFILLNNFTKPNPISSKIFNLLKFGFPKCIKECSVCTCHLEITETGFICPVCKNKYCNLPIDCNCGLTLVSFVNLSKSMYHNYILEEFSENTIGYCVVCKARSFSQCNNCKENFCSDCDDFLHEFLNFCIFCKS